MPSHTDYLTHTLELAYANVQEGGRPFAAIVVHADEIIATGSNEIHLTQDPSAHAELIAIRRASQRLGIPQLKDCIVYASGHPCPMCLSLMHLTGIQQVFYAYSNLDAEPYGLSTSQVYAQLQKPLAEQSITACYLPIRLDQRAELYQVWADHQA